MANLKTRILLFLSSYFPLFLIFTALVWSQNWIIAVCILASGVLCLALMIAYLHHALSLGPIQEIIEECQRRDNEALSYFATYIIPFVTLPVKQLGDIIALAILVLTIGYIYVNSNMIYINPMLSILRYHLYEVRLEGGSSNVFVISHRPVVSGSTVYLVDIGQDIFLEKESKSKDEHDSSSSS